MHARAVGVVFWQSTRALFVFHLFDLPILRGEWIPLKIEADTLLSIYYTIVDDYTLALHACHHHLTRKSRCTAAPTTGVFCSSSFSSALRALLIFRSPGLIHELVVGASAMENVYKVYFIQNQCLKIMVFFYPAKKKYDFIASLLQ